MEEERSHLVVKASAFLIIRRLDKIRFDSWTQEVAELRLSWMLKQIPEKLALYEVANRLKRRRIQFALGGSGLLSFFGCATEINDWDITTDAPEVEVIAALEGLTYSRIQATGIFATRYLFKISLMNSSIDLIGGFALRTMNGIYQVPTAVAADWDGIPVGDPNVWIKVYEILGRKEKANLLRAALEQKA